MRIAIVGNSPILLEKEYGNEIDSHDIVIRFNNYKTEGYEKHCGSKTTDICFNQFTPFNSNVLTLTKEHRLFFYTTQSLETIDASLKKTYDGKITINDVALIDNDKYYKDVRDKLNAENNWQGSSGLIMCQMMCDLHPDAMIDVYGITFFKDTIKRKEGEFFHKIHHMDGSIIPSGHDPEAEWSYYERYLKDKINLHI